MEKYSLYFCATAYADMDELEQFVLEECSAPLTAYRLFENLGKHWEWLEQFAELPAIDAELSIQYGRLIRSIRFGKKMVIIYSVEGNVVYIHRVMPQSMINF